MSMRQNIEVVLRICHQNDLTLSVHPKMTTRQLSEFVLASRLLHQLNPQGANNGLKPMGLQALKRGLLIDYMLSHNDYTMQQVYEASRLEQGHADQQTKHENAQAKHGSHFISRKYGTIELQKKISRHLYLKVCYTQVQHSSKNYSSQYYLERYLLHEQAQWKNELLSPSSKTVQMSSSVELDVQKFLFRLCYCLHKDWISSYDHFQRLLLLKQRLTKLALHRIHIYGELAELVQQKHQFVLKFKYTPAVSLHKIVNSSLSVSAQQSLIDRIWNFVANLRNNNYQTLIYRLVKTHNIATFLVHLNYNIDGSLTLGNPNFIFQQGSSQQMSLQDQRDLLLQIKHFVAYSSIDRRKLYIEENTKSAKNNMKAVSFQKFVQLFKSQSHTLSHKAISSFMPISSFFRWQHHNDSNKLIDGSFVDIRQLPTAKKNINRSRGLSGKKTNKKKNYSSIAPKAKTRINLRFL